MKKALYIILGIILGTLLNYGFFILGKGGAVALVGLVVVLVVSFLISSRNKPFSRGLLWSLAVSAVLYFWFLYILDKALQ